MVRQAEIKRESEREELKAKRAKEDGKWSEASG